MTNTLKRMVDTPVMLGVSTQIEICILRDEGKSYKEIDLILRVPRGSSYYTMYVVRKGHG